MTSSLSSYIGDLNALFAALEIRDSTGKSLAIDEGAKEATAMMIKLRQNSRKAIVIGNGGSAAIASHTQNDFCKAAGIQSLVFTEQPLLTALSNDDGYETAYESLVRLWVEPGDMMLAISSSGRSENILRAVRAARSLGSCVMTMSGFAADNPLRSLGDINFYVPSDSYGYVEIIHAALCQFLTDTVKTK